MFTKWSIVGLTICLTLVAGCGGSGSSAGTPGEPNDAFDALAGVFVANLTSDPATAGQRTAEALASREDVTDSGVMPDGTAYAVLEGGTIWAFVNNREPSNQALITHTTRVGVVSVPNGKKVAVFSTLMDAGWAQVAAPSVAERLQNAGYEVFGGDALIGTLVQWETLEDITFLYADAHGLALKIGETDLFALVTATEATPSLLEARAQDFADRKLIVVSTLRQGAGEGLNPINRVAITTRWFSSRDFLAESSHVFLNACHSGLMTFREIGNPVRAGLVLKWNGIVSDAFAGQFALDYTGRMLDLDEPRKNWLEAYNELGSSGRTDPVTGLEISFNQGQGGFDQFLPEITGVELGSIQLGEANETAIVRGIFGDVSGVVLDDGPGGGPLQVTGWTKNAITVRLGLSTRQIKVQANGRESNSFALGYWKLSGSTGGSFNLSNYMFATLGRQNLQMADNRPVGPAGPYRFEAGPGDVVWISLFSTTNGVGGNDEIVLTSPTGRVTSLVPAMSGMSWNRDLGLKEYFRSQRFELDDLR